MSETQKYKVVVQERAKDMLVAHSRFLSQVSIRAASNLVNEFSAKASSLEFNPERCPWLFDPMIPSHKYRKLLFGKRYLIIFQLIEHIVSIDAVVDCRQDYGWLL